jgi:hypothetical protein
MTIPRLSKLRGRSPAEWIGRSSQAASRWLERIGFGDIGEPRDAEVRRLIGEDDPGPAVRGPFFASLADRGATLEALGSVDHGFADALRARADRILAGRADLLGYRDLALDEPIDWWRDPVSGIRAPDRHWSQIAFLDPEVVGDHKAVWELSRHRALLTVAQAWWCTEDSRYADAVNRLLTSWMDRNVPKQGIHWASSLEIAFRSMAWVWILALMGEGMPRSMRRRVVAHLAINGRHLQRFLSTWFSPNTHLTGEALGLYVLGTALPQCNDAARWRTTGESILLEWVNRHVRNDGTYVEQSTWYHRYTTDFYLHYVALSERAGTGHRQRVGVPLQRLIDVLCWITRPDGTFPLIGDDDGGRLLFLGEQPADNARTTLSVGAALFGRPDWAHVAGGPTTELVWLLGAEGLRAFQALRPTPSHDVSRAFRDGGLYVTRSGWDDTASLCTIDAGPHGFLNGGHAHADALSIDLTVQGTPLFVDPGTFTYTLSTKWRDHFRGTGAHNAATVDGRGSAVPAGPFQWASRASARCDAWFDDGRVLLFSGVHDGFEHGHSAAHYRRTIVYLRPAIWIVRDEVRAPGDHELAVHWQLHSSVTADQRDDEVFLYSARGLTASMRTAEAAVLRMDEGWISPMHGVREASTRVTASRRGNEFVCLTTMINSASVPATIVADRHGSQDRVGIRFDDRAGVLLFGGGRVGSVETDAVVTWIELGPDSEAVAVTAAAYHRLTMNGVACTTRSSDGGVHWTPGEAVQA